MGLFNKKKKEQVIRELHSERYNFEYGTLPSIATYAPMHLFSADYEGNELFNLIIDKNAKMTEWGEMCAKNFCMKIYNVVGGQISFLKFPEPKTSPELLYAAVPLPDNLIEKMKDESDLYYRPFYILAKIIDKWYIGEIKCDESTNTNAAFYYPVYYETIDNPNPVEFIKWVMDKEGFSKNENLFKDPIEEFLNNN